VYGATSAWPIYSDGSYPFLIPATTLLGPHQASGATNSALFALWLGPWRGWIALNIDWILRQPGRNGPPRSHDRFGDALEVWPTLPRSCRTRRHYPRPIRRRYRRAGGATNSCGAPFRVRISRIQAISMKKTESHPIRSLIECGSLYRRFLHGCPCRRQRMLASQL